MAPGTHIGAAHPVTGTGEKMDETTARKAAEDVAAYARTLASRRHRNATLAASAGDGEPRVHRGGSRSVRRRR
jgi:membrane-bound serine protease (ClpP class)